MFHAVYGVKVVVVVVVADRWEEERKTERKMEHASSRSLLPATRLFSFHSIVLFVDEEKWFTVRSVRFKVVFLPRALSFQE